MIIAAIEHYPGCPICQGGNYNGMKLFWTIDSLLEYALEHINTKGIMDIYVPNGIDSYKIEYEESTHTFSGIKLYKNGTIIARTKDNGSGDLMWAPVEG